MAAYKERRARKRASGGSVKGEGEHPPHGGHHMLIIIGLGPKKKKKPGGEVEGNAARSHMGKRARGGPPPRQPPPPPKDDEDDDGEESADQQYREEHGGFGKASDGEPRARGGRTLDAGQDEDDPDGRDRVVKGTGTAERAYEMGDARAKGGHVKFRTPSGSVSQGARQEAEGKGEAMPGGRFPIRNTSDLSNAKHAFGRANDKPAVKRWINKRARDLGEPPMGGE
jgi:hypothetical protein